MERIRFHDQHSHLVGSLDYFEWDCEGNVAISGWGKLFSGQVPADSIIVTNVAGELICETECSTAREDVCTYLGTRDMLYSGWRVYLSKGTPHLRGTDINEVKVYSYSASDNSAYRLPVYSYVDLDVQAVEERNWLTASECEPPDRTLPYYSCSFIEGGIIFLQNHVACICCFSNLNSAAPDDNIHLCGTESSEFSVKRALEKRKQVIVQNQAEGYSACKGCKQLRKKMWPAQRHLFTSVNIGHYSSCNVACVYCRPTLIAKNPTDTPTEEIIEIIKGLKSHSYLAPNAAIAITGGEPAMMKRFDALMELLIYEEYAIQINSNGTLYSRTIADGLESGSIRLLCISVDAITDEVYYRLKGKKYCERVWKHIAAYASRNSESVMPKMIILEENIAQIEGFVRQCREAGVKNVMYDCNQKAAPTPSIVKGITRFRQSCQAQGVNGIPGPSIDRNLLQTN